MLYLIGLGLGEPEDITVKGLNIVKSAHKVYLEAYTSILSCGKEGLEKFYGREVIVSDREDVEQKCDSFLEEAKEHDVAFLVVGDPFGATTHSDLVLRAMEMKVPYKVVHNASIMNAVGCCGLQLYHFGETVSIVFWNESWKPQSFLDKIEKNLKMGLHTLCLLDIKVKEQTVENMMRGTNIFEPPRYQTVAQAAAQLLEIVEERESENKECLLKASTMCVGLGRVGCDDQMIRSAPLSEMVHCDLGRPLHSMIVCGKMHDLEMDFLKQFSA